MDRTVFIHFLDNEFISLFELNNNPNKSYLLQEFYFALRLALLICEDYIIIPLSNIAESPFVTKAILNDLGKFGEFGYVHFASKSLNLSEFFEEKQKQFSLNKNRCPLYFNPNFYNFLLKIQFRWLSRCRNTTKDIADYWTSSIGNTSVWSEIFDLCKLNSVEIFEKEISQIPEKLDQQAFIADFVIPLLPFSITPKLKNRVNLLITKAYIKSYLDEYNAICMSGFTYIDTSFLLPSDRHHILIYEIKRTLFRLQKLDFIFNITSDELLKYKFSQEWDDLKIILSKSYRIKKQKLLEESIETPNKNYSYAIRQNTYTLVGDNHQMKDFFISYNKANRNWAEWIAWHLEEEGYSTVFQAWDFLAGSNFVLEMDTASKTTRRTISVLSQDYLNAIYTQPEWAIAFSCDPTGKNRNLIPIRVEDCDIQGLLAPIVYIDLFDIVDEKLAKKELITHIEASIKHNRTKPSKSPVFPGSTVEHTSASKPTFPNIIRVPKPIQDYLNEYPLFAEKEYLDQSSVRTSRESFFCAITKILENLEPHAVVWSTDNLNLSSSNFFSNYWFEDGLEYLKINFEQANRGIQINRIFIVKNDEYKTHRIDLDLIAALHAKAGVHTYLAIYENLPPESRYDFAIFGDRFIDEVIFDTGGNIVDNFIHWSPFKLKQFNQRMERVRNHIKMRLALSVQQEAEFNSVLNYAWHVKQQLKSIIEQQSRSSNQMWRKGNRPIKILFLAANPSDTTRLRLDQEFRDIDIAVRQSEFRDVFHIEQQNAVRVSDIQNHFLRYRPDIVHFTGHGSEKSEIIFENTSGQSQPISSNALGKLFSLLNDNIKCVVLNACYSEGQAMEIAKHIDCAIGMSREISDSAAINFAVAFYRALGYGRDVQTAYELGCLQIDFENKNEQNTPKLIAIKSNPRDIKFVDD